MRIVAVVCCALALFLGVSLAVARARPNQEKAPVLVEAEEQVYSYQDAGNGAGPLWSFGSTCIARVGNDVFISGLETIPNAAPLNNVRWQLFHRTDQGWQQLTQGEGRTREPCPLGAFSDGTLLLSDNPTVTAPDTYNGPARPEILTFSAAHPEAVPRKLAPLWEGEPAFTEHSYRSFAADGPRKELILFQNIGYEGAAWTFRDGNAKWSAQGFLQWPWGAEYPVPEPIRVCYPTVALKDRKVYFCGVSDIIEPYPQWREYKRQATGRDWDYDFRRLFFTWSDDITTGTFHPWVEIASRDKTCGWIMPCDLWVALDGAVHVLWSERAIDERLREKFFPDAKQSQALMYAVVRDGKVTHTAPIMLAPEGAGLKPDRGRFHVTPDGRLFVLYYVSGNDDRGQWVSQDRLVEVRRDHTLSDPVVVPLSKPFTSFYTATWRAGMAPSDVIDLYGTRAGEDHAMAYARLRIR